MSLPLELIDPILHHLPPRYLLTTALVSHTWSHLSLACFYRSVYIHTKHQKQRFLEALESLPFAYRQCIRAIYVNTLSMPDTAFNKDNYRNDLIVIAAQCPQLDTFILARTAEPFLPDTIPTVWLQGVPASIEVLCRSMLYLPYIPSIRRIGTYLEDAALECYSCNFSHLTSLVLSEPQLQELLDTPSPQQVLFPALETLDLGSVHFSSFFKASSLALLKHHCPVLQHLTLNDFQLFDVNTPTPLPIHTSVVKLALRNVRIENTAWLSIFASMYPALQSLSLEVRFGNHALITHGMDEEEESARQHQNRSHAAQGVLDWIVGCGSLTTLDLIHFGLVTTYSEIMDGLADMASLGSWHCQLNRFALHDCSDDQELPCKHVLECQSLMQRLDTLHLTLPSTHYQTPFMPQKDLIRCNRFPSPMFPPCDLSADALINITTLYLHRNDGHARVSWTQLLQMCPSLTSLSLRYILLQHGSCQRHFPSAHPDSSLVNLTLDNCKVSRADLFFSFLQYQLPRLSSLAMTGVYLDNLDSDPMLDLNVALQNLWIVAVSINQIMCTSLRLHERQRSGNVTRYTSRRRPSMGSVESLNEEHSFSIACINADHVLFNAFQHM
ncbi:hypothetical protein DM01DRAFT_1331044 [Hesseltinella vesiculosa]|uniref:F-box domain-containing protein n=1 Tax=Hesseltinella vesiculosa TaxID=101127 RepID=A0A1X2GY34_9FUNG|nr:hypothetical protein DM01DRAFT_1331044 [Hesseltinella vesiculosa]